MKRILVLLAGAAALLCGTVLVGSSQAESSSTNPKLSLSTAGTLFDSGRNFGRLPIRAEVNTRRGFRVTNQSDEIVTLGKLSMVGPGSRSFRFWMDFCSGQELKPRGWCEVGYTFYVPERAMRIAAKIAFDGKPVKGPGHRANVVGPEIRLLKAPKRISASGQVNLARVACPVACKPHVVVHARLGRHLYGPWTTGPERLKAGGRGVLGIRFVSDLRKRLRSHGKARIDFQACARVTRTSATVCSKKLKFTLRG